MGESGFEGLGGGVGDSARDGSLGVVEEVTTAFGSGAFTVTGATVVGLTIGVGVADNVFFVVVGC